MNAVRKPIEEVQGGDGPPLFTLADIFGWLISGLLLFVIYQGVVHLADLIRTEYDTSSEKVYSASHIVEGKKVSGYNFSESIHVLDYELDKAADDLAGFLRTTLKIKPIKLEAMKRTKKSQSSQ